MWLADGGGSLRYSPNGALARRLELGLPETGSGHRLLVGEKNWGTFLCERTHQGRKAGCLVKRNVEEKTETPNGKDSLEGVSCERGGRLLGRGRGHVFW